MLYGVGFAKLRELLPELGAAVCAYGFGPAKGVEYIGELFGNLGSVRALSCASHAYP